MFTPKKQLRFRQDISSCSSLSNPELNIGGEDQRAGNNYSREIANNSSDTNAANSGKTSAQDSIFATFLAETSIHGVKYIGEGNRHWSERLFWLVAFLLGVSSSAYLIHQVWDRYQHTPVIVAIDVNEVHTTTIPFPAVTICNVNPISKRLVEELELSLMENNSSEPKYIEAETEEKLAFVRLMCGDRKLSGESVQRVMQDKRLDDLIGFLINNTDPCDELIRSCYFNWYNLSCSDVFKPIVTAMGKCCTFNMLPLSLLYKRSNQTGEKNAFITYNDDDDNEPIAEFVEKHYFTKPVNISHWSEWQSEKQPGLGGYSGLSITIEPKADDYYCPFFDYEGVRISLHSPFEIPFPLEYSSGVQLGKQTDFLVDAEITKADPDIQNYPQEKRKCYFENEKQLLYLRPYTGRNCVEECWAEYFAKNCGCTPHQTPNYNPEHKEKHICSSSEDFQCLGDAARILTKERESICPACDPLCEDIQYRYTTSVGNLLSSNALVKENPRWSSYPSPRSGKPRDAVAMVNVFFGSEYTVPKLRKALYGWTDLIANIGGILGLCLGFSVISGIELLYFFTLRTFWNKYGQGTTGAVRKRRSVGTSLNRVFRSKVVDQPSCQPTEEGYKSSDVEERK